MTARTAPHGGPGPARHVGREDVAPYGACPARQLHDRQVRPGEAP